MMSSEPCEITGRYGTIARAADIAGYTAGWMYTLVQQGRVQGAVKFGKTWLIPLPPTILSAYPSEAETK